MSVLINKENGEAMVKCKCGCQSVYMMIDKEDGEQFAWVCFYKNAFYVEQYGAFKMLWNKLKKIWSIIRNKDFYYAEIFMDQKEFDSFKEYINSVK